MQGETPSHSVKTEIVPQTPAHPHHHTSALFDHEHHPYQPRNVNLLHKAEVRAASIDEDKAEEEQSDVHVYLYVVN
ncbi:MAG: hypothetical protein ACXVIK_03925 [Halobacteriota archaeon]